MDEKRGQDDLEKLITSYKNHHIQILDPREQVPPKTNGKPKNCGNLLNTIRKNYRITKSIQRVSSNELKLLTKIPESPEISDDHCCQLDD